MCGLGCLLLLGCVVVVVGSCRFVGMMVIDFIMIVEWLNL